MPKRVLEPYSTWVVACASQVLYLALLPCVSTLAVLYFLVCSSVVSFRSAGVTSGACVDLLVSCVVLLVFLVCSSFVFLRSAGVICCRYAAVTAFAGVALLVLVVCISFFCSRFSMKFAVAFPKSHFLIRCHKYVCIVLDPSPAPSLA